MTSETPDFGAIVRLGRKVKGGDVVNGEKAIYEYFGSRYLIVPSKNEDGHEFPEVKELLAS